MRLAAIFVTACVVLAAAQAIAAAFAVLLAGAVIYGLIAAPKETLGLFGLLVMAALITAQPLAFLGLVALMVISKLLHHALRRHT